MASCSLAPSLVPPLGYLPPAPPLTATYRRGQPTPGCPRWRRTTPNLFLCRNQLLKGRLSAGRRGQIDCWQGRGKWRLPGTLRTQAVAEASSRGAVRGRLGKLWVWPSAMSSLVDYCFEFPGRVWVDQQPSSHPATMHARTHAPPLNQRSSGQRR